MKKSLIQNGVFEMNIKRSYVFIILMFSFSMLACKKDSLPPHRLIGYQWQIYTKGPTEVYWTTVQFQKDSSIMEMVSRFYWEGQWTITGDTLTWNMTASNGSGWNMNFKGVLDTTGTRIRGSFTGGLYDPATFTALRGMPSR